MFSFEALSDPVILEALDDLPPYVWQRLADAIPFMGGDWTWHTNTMIHLQHRLVVKEAQPNDPANGGGESFLWYRNGYQHRDFDLPSNEWAHGTKEWRKNGLHHRDNDLPAIVWFDGDKAWYRYGVKHRDGDLPAYDGNHLTEWYRNGLSHRDNNLPAKIWPNVRYSEWWSNGVLIRAES